MPQPPRRGAPLIAPGRYTQRLQVKIHILHVLRAYVQLIIRQAHHTPLAHLALPFTNLLRIPAVGSPHAHVAKRNANRAKQILRLDILRIPFGYGVHRPAYRKPEKSSGNWSKYRPIERILPESLSPVHRFRCPRKHCKPTAKTGKINMLVCPSSLHRTRLSVFE